MTGDEAKALFILAGIEVLDMWELMNPYWPRGCPEDMDAQKKPHDSIISYWQLIIDNPWWLVKTPVGLIEIGWRKRVICISWRDTPIRKVITADDTTKGETMVHAWTMADAQKYLTALKAEMGQVAA